MSSDKRYDALRRALAEHCRFGPDGYVSYDTWEWRDATSNPDTIRSLIADYDALTSRVEAAERDARRLDWLEQFDSSFVYLADERRWLIDFRGKTYYGPVLRAAIDAASGQDGAPAVPTKEL